VAPAPGDISLLPAVGLLLSQPRFRADIRVTVAAEEPLNGWALFGDAKARGWTLN
jgi:hypothetical protein